MLWADFSMALNNSFSSKLRLPESSGVAPTTETRLFNRSKALGNHDSPLVTNNTTGSLVRRAKPNVVVYAWLNKTQSAME